MAARPLVLTGVLATLLGCVGPTVEPPPKPCLEITPTGGLDFSSVPAAATSVLPVVLQNCGSEALEVTQLAFTSTTASNFSWSNGTPAVPIMLTAGASAAFGVKFAATTVTGPVTGAIEVVTSSATIAPQTLLLTGTAVCTALPVAAISAVVGEALVPPTGVLPGTVVTLSTSQSSVATGLTVASTTWNLLESPDAGSSLTLLGTQTASLVCAIPGTYEVGLTITDSAGCVSTPVTVSIPVQAVPPACGAQTQFIYTVDEKNILGQFDPATLAYTEIGPINCPDTTGTYDLKVDRYGLTWVEYVDGLLFRVDPTTLDCFPTPYVPGIDGWQSYGMSFVRNSDGGEALYLSDNSTDKGLSVLDTSEFTSTYIGPFTGLPTDYGGASDLTGTSDGLLFALFAWDQLLLAQIDTSTGAAISQTLLPEGIATGDGYAVASWGTDFWVFGGEDVYEYSPSTGVSTLQATLSTVIVGAGVSTCVQPQ